MGLWDDIAKGTADDYVDKPENFVDKLSRGLDFIFGVNPQAVKDSSGIPALLNREASDPYRQDGTTIAAITTNRNDAFKIFDVTPKYFYLGQKATNITWQADTGIAGVANFQYVLGVNGKTFSFRTGSTFFLNDVINFFVGQINAQFNGVLFASNTGILRIVTTQSGVNLSVTPISANLGPTVYTQPSYQIVDYFNCLLSAQTLQKFGHVYNGDSAVTSGFPADSETLSNFWRTITITVTGNYARFEWLPTSAKLSVGLNGNLFQDASQQVLTDSDAVTGLGLASPYKPERLSSGVGNLDLITYETDRVQKHGNYVYLDFEQASENPFILQDGMTFKLPFNSFVIHFKSDCPPFRIITGYNSEITISPDQNNPSDIHLSGGEQLLKNKGFHWVPFSISIHDKDTVANTLIRDTLTLNGNIQTVDQDIILGVLPDPGSSGSSGNNSGNNGGLSVGFITDFDCSVQMQGGVNATMVAEIGVYKKVWSYTNAVFLYKKLCSFTFMQFGNVSNIYNKNQTYAVPLRYVLRNKLTSITTNEMQRLTVRMSALTAGNPSIIYWTWALNGYTHGGLTRDGTIPPIGGGLPWRHITSVSQDVYPWDDAWAITRNIVT